MHKCITCQVDKPFTQFYQYKSRNGLKPYAKCKSCYPNNPNYVPRQTGFNKLSVETQNEIIESLKNRDFNLKTISQRFGIEYGAFCYWRTKGLIKLLNNYLILVKSIIIL